MHRLPPVWTKEEIMLEMQRRDDAYVEKAGWSCPGGGAHHWVIEEHRPQEGDTGLCKKCGERRLWPARSVLTELAESLFALAAAGHERQKYSSLESAQVQRKRSKGGRSSEPAGDG